MSGFKDFLRWAMGWWSSSTSAVIVDPPHCDDYLNLLTQSDDRLNLLTFSDDHLNLITQSDDYIDLTC